ncbi:hypothetical protein AVEN_230344-1 [Araneus ventricosus]|uniref:Peptidase C19 ubiquitin carboxyl-terminal hydrolase domain-containing protein n=1 Tax=Araneus ventricosus TaxID=182803 RepID=A0A4Y2I6A0_ARAVE|nr:hypothetical protein AVEN_230344-1 [Araneus ventricosus]
MKDIWLGQDKVIETKLFKKAGAKHLRILENNEEQDSHECLISLIQKISSELTAECIKSQFPGPIAEEYFCATCRKITFQEKRSTIESLPKYIIFHVNRFVEVRGKHRKEKKNISITRIIEFGTKTLKLHSVIAHFGSPAQGHCVWKLYCNNLTTLINESINREILFNGFNFCDNIVLGLGTTLHI